MSLSESTSTSSTGSASAATSSSAAPAASVGTGASGSSGGASPVTSESRPATFQEALQAAGAADTPTPEASVAAQSTPAPAIAEPVTDGAPAPETAIGTPAKGPIPFDRHEAVVRNTRDKTVRDVVSQVERQYGGAIQLQQRMTSDPVGTITQLIDEAVAHPELGQHVISQLARTLGGRARQASDSPLEPIDTEAGPMYTADQVKRVVEDAIAQRLQPLEAERAQRERELVAQRQREETRTTVRSRLSQWEAQPGFSEHKSEIAAKQAEFVAQGADTWTALGLAYAAVVPAKLQATQTTRFVQDAVRKANASTNNPATAAPAVKPRPRDFREAFSQLRGA